MQSDIQIIQGFRDGDAYIIRTYFYGYCEIGYHIFDQKYQLHEKQNMDFLSLSHQYAIYLLEHDWKPLEDHSPEVSLKTWIIYGNRHNEHRHEDDENGRRICAMQRRWHYRTNKLSNEKESYNTRVYYEPTARRDIRLWKQP